MSWIIEHVFGFLYNKVIGVPVKGVFKGLLKLGYMLRKGVEVKKLHIYEDDAQANRFILIPFSVWAFLGILVWLLVILLGVPIVYPLVVWVGVTSGIVAGYLNAEVSEDMKKLQTYRKDIKGQNSNKPLAFALVIVGLVCIGIGAYQVGLFQLIPISGPQTFVLTGKDPNGIRLGSLEPGETGIVKYISGKIISNTKNGYTAPIWGVSFERTDPAWMPYMPYAKEGMWTNAMFVEMTGKRIPFKEGQYEMIVRNDMAERQEIYLNFHEATGYYFDNEGDARFSFEKKK